jgi:acyl-coenzyme A thioesterase PaaI-like protein
MSQTHSPNKLHRIVAKTESLPAFAREQLLTLAFGRLIPYVRTSGVRVESLSAERCVVSIPNAKHVRNHIGGLHAVAMALVAESATGYLVGMNVPDDAVPVIKTMRIDYPKRAKGGLRAVATLAPEQLASIRTQPKGEVTVAVTVTDESDRQPIECKMIWAWTPKRRG